MSNIFGFQENIKVRTIKETGEKIITLRPEDLTTLVVMLYEARDAQIKQGYNATADRTLELIDAIDK